MSQPEKKRKISPSPSTSVSSLPIIPPKLQNSLEKSEFVDKLKKHWDDGEHYQGEEAIVEAKPFRHCEIKNFIENKEFLSSFISSLESITFREKCSDLFQFKQSDDLKSLDHPAIDNLSAFMMSVVQPLVKNITGLPLNSELDMFLSDYQKTDFLLCHDDELDSRRIAFILYLTEEWSQDFGGSLDLFSSSEKFCPEDIVKSVVPEYNKFVFFEVTAKSFHQVKEVVKDGVSRIALSGWFYGEPLPRPTIELPHEIGHNLRNSTIPYEGALKYFCDETYISSDIYTEINDQLRSHSEVLLPNFLRSEVYAQVCENIVEMDVSKSAFKHIGPINIRSYEATICDPPILKTSEDKSVEVKFSNTLEDLNKFFYSSDFMQFLQDVTEFPCVSCPVTKISSSLRKFKAGSYSLLRAGGAKQTGEVPIPLKQKNVSSGDANGNGKPANSESNESEEEKEDSDEEPGYMDIMFFFGSNWDEDWGGLTIYSAEDGEQLITVSPEGNCLALVVRTDSVNPYVNYVNCLSKEEVYFVYTMTLAFNGKI